MAILLTGHTEQRTNKWDFLYIQNMKIAFFQNKYFKIPFLTTAVTTMQTENLAKLYWHILHVWFFFTELKLPTKKWYFKKQIYWNKIHIPYSHLFKVYNSMSFSRFRVLYPSHNQNLFFTSEETPHTLDVTLQPHPLHVPSSFNH